MNRMEWERFILDRYGVAPDHPWEKYPNFAVFRHGENRKWFALMMDVTRDKLGLQGVERLDVVNLRCGPLLAGSLRAEPGIFPAYHMNKDNWITVALDGSVPDGQIIQLLEMSFAQTL